MDGGLPVFFGLIGSGHVMSCRFFQRIEIVAYKRSMLQKTVGPEVPNMELDRISEEEMPLEEFGSHSRWLPPSTKRVQIDSGKIA